MPEPPKQDAGETPTQQSSNRESRLEQVLAEYLRSVELGAPLEEQSLLAQHPDLADDLRSFFRNRAEISRLARPLQSATEETPTVALGTSGPLGSKGSTHGVRVRYFGDYELLDEIARGGMGVVYKARQVSLNRLVALKMILAGNLAAADDVKRFQQEAEAAANLDHSGIVPIYEIGEHEGQHYFSMKLIEGRSLSAALREQRETLTPQRSAALIASVARAVHHAHQRGVLHRDLKPGNILLDADGVPHVTDFGLAKRVEGQSDLTQTGAIVGTPAYMAPEQAQGEKQLSTSADVYSLGAILYELLVGRPPFRGESPLETLLQVMNREPERPSSISVGLDGDLETICLKCLEKEPERRYDSAAALADDLDRWQRGEPIEARATGNLERAWRWCGRNPVVAGLVVSVVLSLVVGTIVSTVLAIEARHQSDQAREFADRAKIEENKARTEAARADAERKQAEANEQVALENNYRSSVIQAQQHLHLDEIGMMKQTLDTQLPKRTGGRDFRRFDWNLLYRIAHGYQRNMPGVDNCGNMILYSPKGSYLATAGFQAVCVFDPARGVKLFDLRESVLGEKYGVQQVVFSPDEKYLAIVDGGEASRMVRGNENDPLGIRLFSLPDGKPFKSYSGSEFVVFSDDMRRFATLLPPPAKEPKEGVPPAAQTHVWRHAIVRTFPEGKLVRELPLHNMPIRHIAFSPDGERLGVFGQPDEKLALWDGTERDVKWDGAMEFGIETRIWEIATGKPIVAYHNKAKIAAEDLFALPRWHRTLFREGQVVPYDGGDYVFAGPERGTWSFDFSYDGWLAAFGSWDTGIHVFDYKQNLWRILRGHTGSYAKVAFGPDGHLASVSWDSRDDFSVKIWNPERDSEGPTIYYPSTVSTPLQFLSLRSGHLLVVEPKQGPGSVFQVWNVATRKRVAELERNPIDEGVLLHADLLPDGDTLVGEFNQPDKSFELRAWSLKSGQRIRAVALPGTPFDLSRVYDPRYEIVLSSLFENMDRPVATNKLQVRNLKTGALEKSWDVGIERWVRPVALSADRRFVACTAIGDNYEDTLLLVYDFESGRLLHQLSHLDIRVPEISISPDSKRLVAASASGWRIWSLADGKLLHATKIPATREGELRRDGPQAMAALSRDCSLLATTNSVHGFNQSRVLVWNVATGQQLLNLPAPNEYYQLNFSSDDQQLIICGYAKDGLYVRIWDGSPVEARP